MLYLINNNVWFNRYQLKRRLGARDEVTSATLLRSKPCPGPLSNLPRAPSRRHAPAAPRRAAAEMRTQGCTLTSYSAERLMRSTASLTMKRCNQHVHLPADIRHSQTCDAHR